MSATINYTLSYGVYPITVSISPEIASPQVQYAPGAYSFTNVPPGTYTLTFADSGGCSVDIPANVIGTSPPPTLTPSLTPTPTRPLLALIQYGLLYNWFAVNDNRQITSLGWRIPNNEELLQLRNYLDPINNDRLNNLAGQAMKETGTAHWLAPVVATNSSGLGFRGSGYRDPDNGDFVFFNHTAGMWSSSEFDTINGVNGVLVHDDDSFIFDIGNQYNNKKTGYSIRPIKDDSIDPGFYIGNDGRRYTTIKVGDQVWTSANLAETLYRNSDSIPEVQSNNIWTGLTTGALCAFNNNWSNAYSPDPSVTPTLTINYTVTPSITPTITKSLSNTPSRTVTRTPSLTRTQSLIISATPSPTPTGLPLGNIHYVSQTGNNSIGTGTISNPWATVSYAASQISTFGHIIHILPGTISESTAFTLAAGVSLEGEGVVSIISSTYSSSFTINLSGDQNIHDLKMIGNSITAYGAIKATGLINNVKIYNNTIIDFSHFGISLENGNNSTPPAIFATGNEVHHNIITNCSGYYGGNLGCLEIDGQDGILIYNNTMSADRGGGNCGDVIYGVEGHHKNVKIYNNTLTKTFIPGITLWDFAIELWNEYDGNEIYNNVIIGSIDIVRAQGKGSGQYCVWIHDNTIGQVAPQGSEETRGINLESYSHMNDIIIERNYVHDVNVGVNHNLEQPNNDENNVRISYNIFNNMRGSGGYRGWGIYYGYPPNRASGVTINNVSILNNVFITGANGMWGIHLPDSGTATNIRVNNNIVEGFLNAVYADGLSGSTINTLSIDHNIFFNNSSNTWTFVNGMSPTSFTHVINYTSDPLFVSLGSNFHLQAGSPAINNGLDVGLTGTLDIGGVTISNPPEIGAYEFTGVPASPSPTITPTSTITKTPTRTLTPTLSKTITMTPTRTPSTSNVNVSRTPSKTPSRSIPSGGNAYYVATNGSDSNPGTLAQPFATLYHGFNVLTAGDTLYVNPGTYTVMAPSAVSGNYCAAAAYHQNGTSNAWITVSSIPGQARPIIDCYALASIPGARRCLYVNGSSYWKFYGLILKNVREYASDPTNRAYVGSAMEIGDSSNITVEHCDVTGCMNGFSVNGLVTNINYINCDAYENWDIFDGGDLCNGFNGNANAGSSITYTGCRAWKNCDDGFDDMGGGGFITYTNCWGFNNKPWHGGDGAGNGDGFKLGYSTKPSEAGMQRTVYNCISAYNGLMGFDESMDVGTTQNMAVYNCISYNNSDYYSFRFDQSLGSSVTTLRNNISIGTGSLYSGRARNIEDHNSWDGGVTANAADFVSTDMAQLSLSRDTNGGLPSITAFHLIAGSDLIGKGVQIPSNLTDGAGNNWNNPPSMGPFENI